MTLLTDFIATHTDEIERLVAEARPTVEHLAAHVLARRRSELLLENFAEIVGAAAFETWLAHEHHKEGERDYRRGYFHGYSQAMDDLRAANTARRGFARAWQSVAAFFNGDLYRWRYCRRLSAQYLPPSYRVNGRDSAPRDA